MQVFAFHLMPYADLDLAARDRHRAAWVVLPNTLFDPEKGMRLYNRYLDELEYCEQVGFDGLAVNEHHQNAYGLMPSPVVMAAALARRTKTAKIAILGNAFGVREHPLTLAEEHAMIDCITGGRLISGMVRGIGAEYYSLGANPTLSLERHQEAHELVVRAWTEPGPFAFEGKHYHFEYVNVWPRPYQKPHPPIWCPSQGSVETLEWAAKPSHRYTYIQTYSPLASVAKYLNLYREIADRNYGYKAASSQIGWAAPTYVAETDERAVEEARPHIEIFFNKLLNLPFEILFPPGYTTRASLRGMLQHKQSINAARRQTIENLIETGIFVCGSPETVRRKITESHRLTGFQNFIPFIQFATLPADLTRKSIDLFAEQVMPHIRRLDDDNYVGLKALAAE
jgi:alkanesulfonate monooxygenase SsuD/methylene tetrahydromethanopterin reductase-like flavin-dependent oxidoreductase (luciferase family)